jgi:hypothetical protein
MLALMVMPAPGEAAVRVWTGKSSRFWSNPLNWEFGQVPGIGDVVEFPAEANNRETINDLLPGLSLTGIVIKGRNYVLAGNRINLNGGITSIPGNSTNRIELDADLHGLVTVHNAGYFNLLELAGQYVLSTGGTLVLRTSSAMLLTGRVSATNQSQIVQQDSGTVTLGSGCRVFGRMIVEHGDLILAGRSTLKPDSHIDGTLIIGDALNASGHARVFSKDSNLLSADTQVTVHRSGILNLADTTYPDGVNERIRSLSGAGVVELGPNYLTVNPRGLHSEFSGEIRGSGTLQLGVIPDPPTQLFSGSLTLSGHSPLAGPVNVDLGHLHLTGSLSNAVITLKAACRLNGNGTARGLVSTASIIRPGPGTLRFLDHCTLDWWTQLWVPLDGPDAARLEASTLEIGSAFLGLTYHGTLDESFTVASTGSKSEQPFRNSFWDLPEGSWVVVGEAGQQHEFNITYAGNGGHDVVLQRVGSYVPPVLRIQQISETERRIAWPLAAHTYWLEHTASFFPRFWSTNGLPAPGTNDTDFFIIENLPGQERYYRLRR